VGFQVTAAARIKFENLLDLAKYAFQAGAFAKVEEHLAEARTIVAFERRLIEETAS